MADIQDDHPLPTLLEWAQAEGWNPGVDDIGPFGSADPDGFFLDHHDDTPTAGISVINHAPDFAFLGLYICAPAFRGQGRGMAVWDRGLQHAGRRTVGLDGVQDQQDNYAKSGFVRAGETLRWQGAAPEANEGACLRANDALRAGIAARDRLHAGFDRPRFLNAWLRETATRQTRVILRDGQIVAHGTIRSCTQGAKIGPLAAETEPDALALISGLVAAIIPTTGEITLDVPASSPALTQTCEALGLTPGFAMARMYRGPAPAAHPPRFAAVATLELG